MFCRFFRFRSNLISVLLYAHFLRMRYYMSTDMRKFLNTSAAQVDALLTPPTAHASVPPAVIKAYATAKEKLGAAKAPQVAAPAVEKKKL